MKGNVTFSVLATQVDAALEGYRDAEQNVKDAREFLTDQQAKLDKARAQLSDAKDAMFEAHPELKSTPDPQQAWAPPGDFTPIEVDDADVVPDFSEHR